MIKNIFQWSLISVIFLCWIIFLLSSFSFAQAPEYSGLWLPEEYFPEGFTLSPYSKATQNNPLRSNGSQVVEFYVQPPGGRNQEHWITVFIDGMTLYDSEREAKKAINQWNSSVNKPTRRLNNIGDEAYAEEGYDQEAYKNGGLCAEYFSKGGSDTSLWGRKLLLRHVRMGRLNVGLRVESYRVDGIENGRRFHYKEPVECTQLIQIAKTFSSKIRKYSVDQGWNEPGESESAESSGTSGLDSKGVDGTPGDSASVSPEKALLAVAGGSMVLTLGVLVQLWGMGGLQSPGDIRGALESLFSSSEGDVKPTESAVPETGAVQEVEVIPKEQGTAFSDAVIQETPVVETVIPDPVPSGFEYQGKVWYKPPWDKGGPYWMGKSDYDAMRSMMRQGKEWSDRWGWVDPAEGKAMEAQNAEAWNRYKSNTDEDIKVITDRIAESQEKLAEIREKQAELERIEQLRERQAELERQRELDNSFATQLGDTWDNYVEGVNRDLDTLPGELGDMALDAARGIRDTTGALITAAGDTVSDLTNGDNWKAVGKAAVDTAKDLILHPVDSSVRVGNVVKDAGSIAIKAADVAGNVAVAIVSDPVAFAESVVGIDNWKTVLDPNVPVGERVSRALYGAVDTALNFASGGTKTAAAGVEAGIDVLKTADTVSDAAKVAKGAEAGLDALKTVDVTSDASKAANAADTAADAARITPKLDDPARVQAWEAGRMAGQQKADRLAEVLKNGDAYEIRQALVECQKDKHAIGALNRADDSIKLAYNQQMKQLITDDVDKVVVDKIAQRYGVDPKDVEIVKPTNPTAKPKVGSDLDFTVKVKAKPGEIVPDPNKPGSFIQVKPGDNLTKDVPVKDAQEIYNRELYSKVTGEPIPTDPEKFKAFQAEADKLAHEMDHVAGHRVGSESYGASQQDLEVILQKSGGRFTDPEQAGMVASYKSTHLYQQAENIAKVNPGKAEALISDGMRQTTKQYSNLIETRVSALQHKHIDVAVHPRLTKAVDILKQVETSGMAPAKAEALLRSQLNMSKDDVANMLGGQLAKLHMIKPK